MPDANVRGEHRLLSGEVGTPQGWHIGLQAHRCSMMLSFLLMVHVCIFRASTPGRASTQACSNAAEINCQHMSSIA